MFEEIIDVSWLFEPGLCRSVKALMWSVWDSRDCQHDCLERVRKLTRANRDEVSKANPFLSPRLLRPENM